MVAALPRDIRLKLEQALGQWRQWRCEPPLSSAPAVVRLLGDGHSNFNVLVRGTGLYVVRIDGINPARHGLNRQGEWRALEAAAAAGLAPSPRYFNPELGCLVCDYLPPDEPIGVDYGQLAALLQGLHALPSRHFRLDLGERIARYEKLLRQGGRKPPPGLQRCREPVQDRVRKVRGAPDPAVLCHNDLLAANRILSGGRLWAVDWEYCAMGSAWYELAVITAGDNMTPGESEALVGAYLERPPRDAELELLRACQGIYRYLELLWYLAPDRGITAGPDLAGRLHALEASLFSPGSW